MPRTRKTRCAGWTKDKKRCKNYAYGKSKYCWNHKNTR